jgi:ribosomal protein L7/L12
MESNDFPGTAVAALERGRKIEAIRIVRNTTGKGLKESKDLVDQYLAINAAAAIRFYASQAEQSKKQIKYIIRTILLAAMVYFLLSRYYY